MKKILAILIALAFGKLGCTQAPAERPYVSSPAFDKKISETIHFTVPTIGVRELKNIQDEVHIFDAREWKEYEVSHIKGAHYLGYDNFDTARLAGIPKDAKIVLYCSIGYRSEKIGEKLQKMGYSQVYNLYGSIFEWVNEGFPVVGIDEKPTQKIHTYNSKWSQWVDNDKAEKVW